MKIYLSLAISVFVLISCTETPSKLKTRSSKDTIKDKSGQYEFPKFTIHVPENKFTIQDSEDQTLVTLKNSKIYVNKNSFEDNQGNDVQGKIELLFNEYHTQGEIIASKLPMIYKIPEGETYDFESAGMFEIRAFQQGKELKLKKGKSIQVDLVTTNPGKFNFYNFNENDLAWNMKDTDCLPVSNKLKQRLLNEQDSLASLSNQQPKKPIELKQGDPVFDINIDYRKYPNLRDLNGLMWKITETNDSLKTAISSRLFKKKYTFFRLEPTENQELEFKLFFINGKDTITFNGAPVMKGKLLSQQQDKYKELIATIHKNVKRENQIHDQIKREKDLLRTFNVDQLGIYNCDRQYNNPKLIELQVNFTYEGIDSSTNLEDVSVYLIPSAQKVVIRYTDHYFDHFKIDPLENNKIIAILPNNEIYFLSNKDIHELNLFQEKSHKIDIQLKKYKNNVKEAKQLDELIAKI